MRALLSYPNHLSKASSTNTVTLGSKFQCMELWAGGHKHSVYLTNVNGLFQSSLSLKILHDLILIASSFMFPFIPFDSVKQYHGSSLASLTPLSFSFIIPFSIFAFSPQINLTLEVILSYFFFSGIESLSIYGL